MKQDKSLVVVGSVATDTIKTPFGSVEKALGGSAVYFSCAARLFCNVDVVGVVGEDFDHKHLELLNKLGVKTDGIVRTSGKTFHWQGYYTENLNEAITEKTELNVFADFNPQLNEAQAQSKHVFLANIAPQLQLNVLEQVKDADWIACDTMNFWISSAKAELTEVLKRVDICLMNDGEVKQFTGQGHLKKAVSDIMKLGPSVVVVKRGEYGAWCFTSEGYFALPAYLLDDVQDPTGAGDSFAGGFLGYLTAVEGKPKLKNIRIAALQGSLCASFNVQSFSVNRLSTLNQEDLNNRLQDYKKSLVLSD